MEQIPISLVKNVLNNALREHFDSFNYATNEFLKCFRWSDNKNIPLQKGGK